ncbi:hypothetical protein GCM10020254_55910 [Streptomyces goshikiensis]
MEEDEDDLLVRRREVRLDFLHGVGGQVLRVAHGQDLALREERGARQLGQRAGLELLGHEVPDVRVGVDGPGGRHHLPHGTVEEQVLLPHREGERSERIVGGVLPGGHRLQHPMPH